LICHRTEGVDLYPLCVRKSKLLETKKQKPRVIADRAEKQIANVDHYYKRTFY